MANDLFAALNVSRFADIVFTLEHRVELMFKHRHDYPAWPLHDGQPDEYERGIHEPMRHTYYATTKVLIHTLRELRKAI